MFESNIRIGSCPECCEVGIMANGLKSRIEKVDWDGMPSGLGETGHYLTPPLLSADECDELVAMYADESRFRSHIIMARYRFGSGDYKYFAYPLPEIVREMRSRFYPHLAEMANQWNAQLGNEERFPATHEQFTKVCHERGQTRPTPLLLHYESGDYNCLHQDVYGAVAFPLQLTCFLTAKTAYLGGEFVLVENQPRAQSKAVVLAPEQGQVLVFATRSRPVRGKRGYFRVGVRHGVSPIRSGMRYTLGVPFHDAE
jgi:uncharacterized protein